MRSYAPLVERQEIADAWATFCERMQRGSEPVTRVIGWQGGSEEHDLHWHARAGIWCAFESNEAYGHHSSGLGTEDPRRTPRFDHVLAINPTKEGLDRNCAGLFVRDDDGVISVTHSGKLGGGRAGISKAEFIAFYTEGQVGSVRRPGGGSFSVFVIGRIDADDLVEKVAAYVKAVQRYKQIAVTAARSRR